MKVYNEGSISHVLKFSERLVKGKGMVTLDMENTKGRIIHEIKLIRIGSNSNRAWDEIKLEGQSGSILR